MNKRVFVTLLILLVVSGTFAGACYAEDPVVCPYCNATGKYTCSICGGDGLVTCDTCSGEGIVEADDGSKVACTICEGTGESECTDPNCRISRLSDGMCPFCQGCGYVDSTTGNAATDSSGTSQSSQGVSDNTDSANQILNGGSVSSGSTGQDDGKLKLNNQYTEYSDLLDENTEEGKAKMEAEGIEIEDEEADGEFSLGSEDFWVKVGMYGFIGALVFLALIIAVCAIIIKARKFRNR